MKSFLAALLIAVPALAHAYTWDQTIDFNPAPQINPFNSYSFTHDLTAPGVGFVVGSDTISDYNLTISLHNDQGFLDIVTIDQPGNIFSDGFALLYNWKVASVTTNDSYEGILSLSDTGMLSITVNSLFGNFFLDSSQLVAVGEQGPSASVPEPASVALLAVGLIGIAVMRRASRAV
jgi:hypothetical protein